MEYKKKILIIFLLCVVISVFIYIFKVFNAAGTAVFLFSSALAFVFGIIFFIKEQVFTAWKKFAIIYVPISMVLIAIASPRGDMFFPSMQETLIFLLPGIFIVASLYVIISKSIKLRKK